MPRLPARLNVRKSIDSLSAQELSDFRQVVKQALALNDKRGFDYLLAGLPWHRAYLYGLELAPQSQVPGVTLP